MDGDHLKPRDPRERETTMGRTKPTECNGSEGLRAARSYREPKPSHQWMSLTDGIIL